MFVATHDNRRSAGSRSVEVFVVIGIFRDWGWQYAILDHIREHQDAFQPLPGINGGTHALAHAWVRKRSGNLVGDGGGDDQFENPVLKKKAKELARRTFRPDRRADEHVGVEDSANQGLLSPRLCFANCASPLLRGKSHLGHVGVSQVTAFLLIEKLDGSAASDPAHLLKLLHRHERRERFSLSFDHELVVSQRDSV
jgi:hypothetical protein